MATVLLIEDDLRLATFTQMTLEAQGYTTLLALNGSMGRTHLQNQAIDLVLLDLDLPDISGIELCREFRLHHSLPILFFSAKGQVAKKIEALEAGANDYIVKPIDIRELLARVKAQLNALSRQQPPRDLVQGQLTYALQRQEFYTPIGIMPLSEVDHQLLACLVNNENQLVSKEILYQQAWSGTYQAERDGHLIEIHISRLRKQLSKFQSHCRIQTVYKKGYSLIVETPAETSEKISLGQKAET